MKKIKFNLFQFGYCVFTFISLLAVCDFAAIFNKYDDRKYNIHEMIIHLIIIFIILFLYYIYCKMKRENEELQKKNKIFIDIIDKQIIKK